MLKFKFHIISSLFLILIIAGCEKEEKNDINNDDIEDICETDNVSYASKVSVILEDNQCTGCHNDINNQGNIQLHNYTAVKSVVDNGRLLGSIKHQNGFSAMPQGGDKIAQCDIDQIEAWVNDGALDN